jgi:hypothetical protein
MILRPVLYATVSFAFLLLFSGCAAGPKIQTSPSFTIANTQKMVPIVPFANTLVPEAFSEMVFNDFVDGMNDHQQQAGFSWFGIVKDDMKELEKVLLPTHIYITGEIWSYIENSGCCSTELRVKSRLRIHRVQSRELLWQAEIPLDSFFEHDASTFPLEREKIGKRLSNSMIKETLKALQSAKRINPE